MISTSEKRLTTNLLLMNELDLYDEFDSKSLDDFQTPVLQFYQHINNLINKQTQATIDYLESDQAAEDFYNIALEDQELLQALDEEWEKILSESYDNIDELLEKIYATGKKKGYKDIKEKLIYTPADREALRICKDYNFELINGLSDDYRITLKNKIFEGILTGLNPYSLAKDIKDTGLKPLKNSTFTADQRAVMIAKTETSRIQNTGILQSFVNEGFVDVKILTAEDNHVCSTCLYYAYHYNDEDHITFESCGKERVHNIWKLIKGGLFPPFHPNCRCTYLSVWESKTNPPKNPQIINLTPLSPKSFESPKEKYNVPEFTKKQLNKLSPAERDKYYYYKMNIPRFEEMLNRNLDDAERVKLEKRLSFFIKKMEDLKQKALSKTDNVDNNPVKPEESVKPKEPSNNDETLLTETIDELIKELPIQESAFKDILKWSDKKLKNKNRTGHEFQINTGELIGKDVRAKNGLVQFNTIDSPEKGRITIIPKKESQTFPDKTSLKLTRANATLDYIFISESEVWYIHSTEKLGIYSVMGNGQKDIDNVYNKVKKSVDEKVKKQINDGKLSSTDDTAIKNFINKSMSDGLLEEFNKKEWLDKGFSVRRALREIKENQDSKRKPHVIEKVDLSHIDKSKLTYDNLSTPEEIAVFYGLEYEREVNPATGKVFSQRFTDNLKYVDTVTGEVFNHKMELNFDSTFVGPHRQKTRTLLDLNNQGKCKYDQKELVRIYKEAPEILKFATGSITFTGNDRISGHKFDPRELGNATPVRNWTLKDGKYFAEGVNSIMMPYLSLAVPHGQRGTVRQTLYHEMNHCFDYMFMDKDFSDLIIKGITTGLTRDEIRFFNNIHDLKVHGIAKYGGDFDNVRKNEKEYQQKNNYPIERSSEYGCDGGITEDWPETACMAAMGMIGNLKDAVQTDYHGDSVKFKEWVKYHKPTYEYAFDLLKNTKPTQFMYNSNIKGTEYVLSGANTINNSNNGLNKLKLEKSRLKSSNVKTYFKSDNTIIKELNTKEIQKEFTIFREFTNDSPIEKAEFLDIRGNMVSDVIYGTETYIDIPPQITLNALRNGAKILIHCHPKNYNCIHSITDIQYQIAANIQYSVVESYSQRFIIVYDDKSSIVSREQLIMDLDEFEKNFQAKLKRLTDEKIVKYDINSMSDDEYFELRDQIWSEKYKENHYDYQRKLSNFFNADTGLKLYVHDVKKRGGNINER